VQRPKRHHQETRVGRERRKGGKKKGGDRSTFLPIRQKGKKDWRTSEEGGKGTGSEKKKGIILLSKKGRGGQASFLLFLGIQVEKREAVNVKRRGGRVPHPTNKHEKESGHLVGLLSRKRTTEGVL